MSQPSEKGQKRKLFHEGAGLEASLFRKKVLHSLLHHAREDTFELFTSRTVPAGTGESSLRDGHGNGEKPEKPNWLRIPTERVPAFVRSCHIKVAREKYEKSEGNARYDRMIAICRGSDPTDDDVAEYAMSRLYLLMTEVLQECRRVTPTTFFDDIGYLFDDWSSSERVRGKVDKSSLELHWVSDFNSFSLDEEHVCPSFATTFREDPSSATGKNEAACKEFAGSRPELEIIAMHWVYVKTGRKQATVRKHAGDLRKKLRTTINLFDVVGNFIRALCGFENGEDSYYDILKFSIHSIDCLYALALFFRDMIRLRTTPQVR